MTEKFPNIILIVMDTVRVDHLSSYGYHLKTSPNIDKIAEQGVLFENAFSTATWSPPAHASIFTGKYPSYHKTLGTNLYLARDNVTIAEILKANGYSTMGITNCALLGAGTGFERGFQKFVEPSGYVSLELRKRARTLSIILDPLIHAPKDFARTLVFGPDGNNIRTNEIIKGFIKTRQVSGKPFFLFVNYFNCHAPYDPPRPFKEKFCDGFTEPRLYITELLWEKLLGKEREKIVNRNLDMTRLKYIASVNAEARFAFIAGGLQISEEEWEVIRSWYDGEIAYLDHCIGEITNFLCNEGLFENTLIIITADHGENFGEHGLAGHNFALYDSLLHVPLIMSCPSLIPKRKRLAQIVSIIDIFPTVLSLCNLDVKYDVQGKRLDPFEEREIHDFVCAECGATERTHGINSKIDKKLEEIEIEKGCKCIRNSTYKYILRRSTEELYDIRDDPREQTNIATRCPEMTRHLRRKLEQIVDISYFGPRKFLNANDKDKAMMKRLKALGYV